MTDALPISLPTAAPTPPRMAANSAENSASGADQSDSFASALQSAQDARSPDKPSETASRDGNPDSGAANVGADAATGDRESASSEPATATDPSAAVPLFGLPQPGLVPNGMMASAVGEGGTSGSAGSGAGANTTLAALQAALPATGGEGNAGTGASPAVPVANAAVANGTVAASSVQGQGTAGSAFATALATLGQPSVAEGPVQGMAANRAVDAQQATSAQADPAAPGPGQQADGPALELKLPEVLTVSRESPVATVDGATAQAAPTSPAQAQAQAALASARSHAGVLHLDSQLPVHTPRFADGLGQHVVVLTQAGIQQAQMSLNPPELGPIDVRITLQQDSASVQIAAASAVARDAIQDALPKLRDLLDQSGVRLNDAGVFAQLPQREQSAGGQAQRSDWLVDAPFRERGGAEGMAPTAAVVRRVGLLDAYA